MNKREFSFTKSFWVLAVLALLLAQLACQAVSGGDAPPEPPATQASLPTQAPVEPATLAPTIEAPGEPTATSPAADIPTQAALPTQPGSDNDQPGSASNSACFGSAGSGLTCLDDAGWIPFASDSLELGSGYIDQVAACGDHFLVVTSTDIHIYDGQNWKTLDSGWGIGTPDAVACSPDGDVWVAHFQGASHFDGTSWTTYPMEDLTAGASAAIVEGIAAGPDGKAWVLTSNAIAGFDGSSWQVFAEGQGFAEMVFFNALAVDEQGNPWVSYSQSVATYDGQTWNEFKNSKLGAVEDLAVDPQGRVWVGTFADGVFVLENGQWSSYNTGNSDLSSNHVRAIAVDNAGRAWLGTTWGLNIFDGQAWQTYRMHNSDLLDQDVNVVAVNGNGPALPEPVEKETGSMSGKLVYADGSPVANAVVEICIETLSSVYYGDTPCSDQAFLMQGQTNPDGTFSLTGIPAGYYILTVETNSGWAQLVGEFGTFSERVLVEPGQDSQLDEITIEDD
jgi:hypothetical protein